MDVLLLATGFTGALTLVWLVRLARRWWEGTPAPAEADQPQDEPAPLDKAA